MRLMSTFRLRATVAQIPSHELYRYRDMLARWYERTAAGIKRFFGDQIAIIDRDFLRRNSMLEADNMALKAKVAALEAERPWPTIQ